MAGNAFSNALSGRMPVRPVGPERPIRVMPPVRGPVRAPIAHPVAPVALGGIPSYDEGSDSVPQTGPAIVHEGEAIIPAAQNPNNPDNQQMPSDVAPPDMSSIVQNQSQQMPDLGQFNPQMPRQPRLWERVLRGALQGFEMGGIPGAIRGGIDPAGASQTMHDNQQTQAANVRFEDARAANMVAEAGLNDAKLHNQSQEIQDAHNESAAKVVKDYTASFGNPTMVVKNTGPDAMQALENQTKNNGSVGHMIFVNTGNQIIAWSTAQIAESAGVLDQIHAAGKALGLPAMSSLTQAAFDQMPKAAQTHYIESMNSVTGTVVPGKTEREQQGQISTLQTHLATVKALPDSDADKAGLMSTIQKNLTLVQKASKMGNQAEVEQAAAKTKATENAKREITEPEIDVAAKGLIDPNNLTSMQQLTSLRNDQRLRVYARAKQIDPTFNPGLIDRRVKFLDSYEDPKGRAATNRQAINNVTQHAADLSDLNQNYRRTDVKILNTPVNKLRAQGSPAYTQYETTLGVLKDELSLYFAGGYAPSKEQQDTWNKLQSGDATPGQAEAFAKEVVHLASRRASTFNSQFKTVMGQDDPNMITPDAKAASHRMGLTDLDKFGSGGQIGGQNATNAGTPNMDLVNKHKGQ